MTIDVIMYSMCLLMSSLSGNFGKSASAFYLRFTLSVMRYIHAKNKRIVTKN